MFSEGVQRLLDALPNLAGLDRLEVRRLLSGAWLDAVGQRDFLRQDDTGVSTGGLRRLAMALEVRLFVGGDLTEESSRATAFVAAEALGVIREIAPDSIDEPARAFGSVRRFEIIEEALLYLAAGFDANAALTGLALDAGDPAGTEDIAAWVLGHLRALVDHARAVSDDAAPAVDAEASLAERVRHEIWRRLGALVRQHVRWLRMLDEEDPNATNRLRELAADLTEPDRPSSAAHPDLRHLCLLAALACEDTAARALRRVPPPPDDGDRFAGYQRRRARRRPLLWPAAARYADDALPGPGKHAVVTVPTGAGKSSVAELAAAQALHQGWVLYLAPTNALVAQIRRDLIRSFTGTGVTVRGLTGGAEYTVMVGDTLKVVAGAEIAVMTPEKCSLALRQSPELFESLALVVMDEAHLIGDAQSRGVIAELVLAEVMHRSPGAHFLLLSALVSNPRTLAEWLTAATGTEAIEISEPWRPTRTLRALCGVDLPKAQAAAEAAWSEFENLPERRKNVKMALELRLLGALHGTWTGDDPADYSLVETGLQVITTVNRKGEVDQTGHTAPATRAMTQALAEAGHRVLCFLPGDRHLPFSHARELKGSGAGPGTPVPDVESLLTLADAEIAGVAVDPTGALRRALAKGIALHTSAMITEEQRASELAFERGAATVMLATGTLAQGLNLPATAVVIGGTAVGDRREADTPEGIARAKAQLLNAIGRAGRAQTAARSLAVVVPNRPIYLADAFDVASARNGAAFLAEEDGSTQVESSLGDLIADTLGNRLEMETMAVPEQTAFAFLSFTAESGDATSVLARTLAAHRADAAGEAERVTDALRALGRQFLDRESAPAWIATAAHRAGITLPAAVGLERALRNRLSQAAPASTGEWATTAISLLQSLNPAVRAALLDDANLSSTTADKLRLPGAADRAQGWRALELTLAAWLDGMPLIEVGGRLHGSDEAIDTNRAKGAKLPRTIRFVRNGIEHDLTTVAGAVVALVTTGAELDESGPWDIPEPSLVTLARLPVAVRSGAADPAPLALLQAGLRSRVVAHKVAQIAPPPVESDDDDLARWAFATLDLLEDGTLLESAGVVAGDREILLAAAHVRASS